MPDDLCPGEAVKVGAAVAVAEDPPVQPGLVELPEVPGHDPMPGLSSVTAKCPPEHQRPQVIVEFVEGFAGHRRPVVVGPASDNRVEPPDDIDRCRSAKGVNL